MLKRRLHFLNSPTTQLQANAFAFAPLLHHFRAVLDPGVDALGDLREALCEQVEQQLQKMHEPRSIEAMFLRKELQIGSEMQPCSAAHNNFLTYQPAGTVGPMSHGKRALTAICKISPQVE